MQAANQHPRHTGLFVQQVLQQDEGFLKELYDEHFRAVEIYVTKNSGQLDDAYDLYQEVFLAVWRNIQLGKFHPADKVEFGAYLFQVAKFKWIDQLRARKVRPISGIEAPDLPAEEWVPPDPNDAKRISEVREKFALLGENCRQLLHRFYFLKQRLQEIARHFKWTEPTAKNNKYRCLQQLRTLLRDQQKKDIQ
ncbi:MAG: sigma-70 family RNA polymerase sigma factor [Chitinophagaceae bacterium]|nr:sigma-70 family RNA polymerase sigma factor [Chitinophagaceae bacterium]